jgi:DMSO reductase family type II enzyme heme b subunit
MDAVEQTASPPVENIKTSGGKKAKFNKSPVLVILGAFALATLMWAVNFQPVSSESSKLLAPYLPTLGDTFLDPKSPVWAEGAQLPDGKKVETAVVTLSAQYFIKEYGGSITQLKAKAAHDGKNFAIWVQWQDNSFDIGRGPANSEIFSDAAAVEFPLDPSQHAGRQAFRCMGQIDALVNIWQWKAERDAEITRSQGFEPILTSGGSKAAKNWVGPNAAYLVDPAKFDPDSRAFYDQATKTWTVIFKREVKLSDKKAAVDLVAPKAGDEYGTQVAFAVWDGGNGERLSKKTVSSWVDLTLQEGDKSPQMISDIINLSLWGLLLVGGIIIAWRFLPSFNREQ